MRCGEDYAIVWLGPAQCAQGRDGGEQITQPTCLQHEYNRHPLLLATRDSTNPTHPYHPVGAHDESHFSR
ncbi:hypothetical protein GCM10023318_25460 [Nocardia callitridis]|uniref:Uncharacterized protein n=1 Tax=Nocardia callitridis TaxID=648753 RepID=A0ABP9KB32_9NOCA